MSLLLKIKPVVQPLASVDNPLRGLPAAGRATNIRLIDMKKAFLRHAFFGVVLAFAITQTTHAITVRGLRSCGIWVEEESKDSPGRMGNQTWLIGYISGLAIGTGKDVLKGTENTSLFLWMTNYCRANPLKDIGDGGAELYFELLKKQK
jgi:hypothetical protein